MPTVILPFICAYKFKLMRPVVLTSSRVSKDKPNDHERLAKAQRSLSANEIGTAQITF